MFILITISIFILKFLFLGVVGMFLKEDLELVSAINASTYTTYMAIGIGAFVSLLFFILGKKLLWLIVFCTLATFYIGMYNTAPGIKEIHQEHNIKDTYFKDISTLFSRLGEVLEIVSEK